MAPNLLDRNFTAATANSKWVSDTTFVPTGEGWLYVAVILDLFSRLVVGWAMGACNDEELVRSALEMALLHRRPPAEMLPAFRSSQSLYQLWVSEPIRKQEIVVSMSRIGDCYDNAAMESFFSTLKTECVHRAHFRSRTEARQSIFEYIECFYNRQRRHSTLNYVSPVDYEQQMS